jgi:hypothetical protein
MTVAIYKVNRGPKMRGFYRQIAMISFLCTSLFSNAAIPPQQLNVEIPKNKPVEDVYLDIAKLIPTNLQPGQNEEQIGMKVADYSFNNFANGDFFKNTEIGKAAKGFEESLKTEVNLGGDPAKGEISHSVNLQVLAFEQKAWVHYKGFTDFQVTYQTNDSNLDVEMQQNLGGSTHLVLAHNLRDSLSRASLSWNW